MLTPSKSQEERTNLSARRSTVLKDIEEAKERNETEIESEVGLWLDRANGLIQEECTEGKKKWFGLVPNCFWMYKRGKDLEGKKQRIKQLVEQSNNFPRVARSTGLPGIEYYSSGNFMHLKDRKLKFEELKEALKDDNKFMIGLYGMGGTGKTTLAIQAGREVAESKLFNKVIFSVVPKDANLKDIRENIAKNLNFPLNEGNNNSEQAQKLWKRISEGEEKVLIILDDVWKKLELRDIGIPLGRHSKGGYCYILLTTRKWTVCRDMGCVKTIEVEVLNDKDALDLCLFYAGMSTDSSSNDYKHVALGIMKECERLPVAIVAVARALKSRPSREWDEVLGRLRNPEPIHDVSEDLKEAYNSLRLSYDYLKNPKAKQFFFLCSLFPEDYEIPIELLTRIAISLGLCGEANKYSVARMHFTPIKNELIDSSLLIKAQNESVKMHDLVREVALWIGNKQVQVAMDSNTSLMEGIRYSSWNINDFPNHFDGRKLEVLLAWINKAESPIMKVPNRIFEGMSNLRILALMNWSGGVLPSTELLFQSPLSLINVRTLVIRECDLRDISILAQLKSLECLELRKCSIIELPNKIGELQKLRLLEMVRCTVQRNNPFKVIGSCLKLEELYYVSNSIDESGHESQAQITALPKLQSYEIAGWRWASDISVSTRRFDSTCKVNFSNEIFKYLSSSAEVLRIKDNYYDDRGWTNIVPDIVFVQDDNMKDHLVRLSLNHIRCIKCLICTKDLGSDVAIFSKLVKLELNAVEIVELCCGHYPVDFLKQLKKLYLSLCSELEGTLFHDKLELCNLKSIQLYSCSVTCLFHPSTAQSLKQLETLDIDGCINFKYVVAEIMDDHHPNQKNHDSLFPKLKYLQLERCPELEFILPIGLCNDLPLLEDMRIDDCKKLKHIFGKYPEERDLPQMKKEAIFLVLEEVKILRAPNFISIYASECSLHWPCPDEVPKASPRAKAEYGSSRSSSMGCLCCFWPKSNASAKHHPSAPVTTQKNHNQALEDYNVVNGAQVLLTAPLYSYRSLRSIYIQGSFGLKIKTLFTLSIASSLKFLKILKFGDCNTLEHIVQDEKLGQDHMNVNSIFPKLREVHVFNCSDLEYIFPAFYSKEFKDLESMEISRAEKLTHVFGKCHADDQDHNVAVDLNLPALKKLHLDHLPNMVSICAERYYIGEVYPEDISLKECPQLPLETSIDLLVVGQRRQEYLSRTKDLSQEKESKPLSAEFKDMIFQNLSFLIIQGCKTLKFIFSASSSRTLQKLEKLEVSECEELVSIIEDVEENKINKPMAPHQQVCFPELRAIVVKKCKSMKCLFSISSCDKFARLLYVNIEDVPQLLQVFGWNQGEGKKLGMEDVFPELFAIRLVNLPTLNTICQGIDFQTVDTLHVIQCPNTSLSPKWRSSKWRSPEWRSPEWSPSDSRVSYTEICQISEVDYYRAQVSNWDFEVEEVKRSQNYRDGKDSTMNQQNISSPNTENNAEASKENEEAAKEATEEDSMNSDKSRFETVEDQLSTVSSDRNDLDRKARSSTHSKITIPNLGTSAFTNETCEKESKGDQEAFGEATCLKEPTNDLFTKETSKKVEFAIPASTTTKEKTSLLDPSIFTLDKPQIATPMTHTEPKSSQLDPFDISITTESRQVELMVNHDVGGIKFERKKSQVSEEHDLMRLFQIMKEGADMEADVMPNLSKIIAHLQHDQVVSKAFADLEGLLKMNLSEIACSEESKLRLENALNILSSHCSEDEAPSHGLQATIHSLQQEIQTLLSSFNRASSTIETFTKLQQKEKLMIEQRSKREKDAKTLLSDINITKDSIVEAKNHVAEAQKKEAELKEQISNLQAELRNKEIETKECERKLLYLQEQENKSVSDTVGFAMEFLAMEKERSHMVEDQLEARQQLEKMEAKWSSWSSNLKKTTILLGVLLKQKLCPLNVVIK